MSAAPLSLDRPLVVVGSGPAGHRLIQAVRQQVPTMPIVWYGDEPWAPYDRARLSSLLAGEVDWDAITEDTPLPEAVDTRFGCRVQRIDRAVSQVIDASGRRQTYGALVLATGSRPHVPSIPGMKTPGVFTFRDLNDAQKLQARSVRSRVTVIVGGGLLGLELARAMRRFHTRVIVIEHADRLMPRQLDEVGSRCLLEAAHAAGIEVRLAERVKGVEGGSEVKDVLLRSGEAIPCDTVIVAAGIVPNNELALRAGLHVGRGIKIDDATRTSDERIHAVGECAEHRGLVHGRVAPGLAQAAVAANRICGGEARYTGSLSATHFTVLGCQVFSVGEVARASVADTARERRFADLAGAGYRRIMTRHGRLVGAQAIGAWDEVPRVLEAMGSGRRLWPWQRLRFLRSGRLWPGSEASDVRRWPAEAIVCHCTGVTRGQLSAACGRGEVSVQTLGDATGAGGVCGNCEPLLATLAGGDGSTAKRHGAALAVAALIALVATFGSAVSAIAHPDTGVGAHVSGDTALDARLERRGSGFPVHFSGETSNDDPV